MRNRIKIAGKYGKSFFMPDWETIADGFIEDYGETLEKKAIYKPTDNEEFAKYGHTYQFCFDCTNFKKCKLGKLLKKYPLNAKHIESLKYYRQGKIRGRSPNERVGWLVKMITLDAVQKKVEKIFRKCPYRETALKKIRKAKKKAGVKSPANSLAENTKEHKQLQAQLVP